MSTSTKVLFIIAFLLLIYGYLCRLLNIYFFWDSKRFGWIMLATGLMGFFIDLKKILGAQKKSSFIPQFFIVSKTYQDAINRVKTVRIDNAHETAENSLLLLSFFL